MQRLRPFKIISIGFAVILVLMAFLTTFGLLQLYIINERLEEIVHEHGKQSELAYKIQLVARQRIILPHSIIAATDVFEQDALVLQFDALPQRIVSALAELQAANQDEQEKDLIIRVRQNISMAYPLQQSVLYLALKGKTGNAKALLLEKALPAQEKTIQVLEQFANWQFHQVHLATAQAKSNYQSAVIYIGKNQSKSKAKSKGPKIKGARLTLFSELSITIPVLLALHHAPGIHPLK